MASAALLEQACHLHDIGAFLVRVPECVDGGFDRRRDAHAATIPPSSPRAAAPSSRCRAFSRKTAWQGPCVSKLVTKRPGLDAFLAQLSRECEVHAYSTLPRAHAAPVLDRLDPRGEIFRVRYYRDSCTLSPAHGHVSQEPLVVMFEKFTAITDVAICLSPQICS